MGLDPKVFILNNILLHCINVMLVLWFIVLLCGRFDIAFITAVLFAVHPIHVESVVWIVERKDVLYTFFYLGSMVSYIYGIRVKKKANTFYALSLFLFLGSLLSKPAAVTLPVVLLLIDFYYRDDRRFGGNKAVHALIHKIPFFMLSGVFALIGLGQKREGLFDIYSHVERIMVGSYALMVYVVKLFAPLGLSCFYPMPDKVNNSLPVLFVVSPFVLLFVLCFFVYIFRKKRELLFGLLFYCSTMFLVTFMGASTALMADRYMYVPSIGIFFILAYCVCHLIGYESIKKVALRIYAKVFISILFVILAFMTFERCKVWKNGITLWSDVISKYDNVEAAYVNRGNEYGRSGQYDLALADYEKALALAPNSLLSLTSRGYLFYLQGDHERAVTDLSKAISLYPNYIPAYLNRSLAYEKMGKYREAADDLIKAKAIEPHVSLLRLDDLKKRAR